VKPKKRKKRRAWPDKHRQKLAGNIREWQPWKQSTGPKTGAGKAAIRQNALIHGFYTAEMAQIPALLRLQRNFVKRALARQSGQNMLEREQ
jgi:hypothetical protein